MPTDLSDSSVEIEVQLTFKEYLGFVYIEHYSTIGSRLGNLLGAALLISSILIVKSSGIYVNGEIDIRLIFMFFFGFFILVVLPAVIFFKAKRLANTSHIFKRLMAYHISDDGISISKGEQQVHIYWNQIALVKQHGTIFMLETQKQKRYYLPKRCFANAANEQQFREIIKGQQHLEQKLK